MGDNSGRTDDLALPCCARWEICAGGLTGLVTFVVPGGMNELHGLVPSSRQMGDPDSFVTRRALWSGHATVPGGSSVRRVSQVWTAVKGSMVWSLCWASWEFPVGGSVE